MMQQIFLNTPSYIELFKYVTLMGVKTGDFGKELRNCLAQPSLNALSLISIENDISFDNIISDFSQKKHRPLDDLEYLKEVAKKYNVLSKDGTLTDLIENENVKQIYINNTNRILKLGMLNILDYAIVFVFMLFFLFSGAIFGYKNRKTTLREYTVPHNTPVFQVSLSLIASFISAISLLGIPSEIYRKGTSYTLVVVSYFFAILGTVTLFLPVFYKIIDMSIFEYLNKRFNKVVALYTACMFVVQTVLYLSLALYAPALAVSTVEGINIWYIIGTISLVTTLYTSLGGMKIVLWSDAIQASLILIGPLFIIIEACVQFGGITSIFKKFSSYEKLTFFNFSPDPTSYNTVWQLFFGSAFVWMGVYSTNQCEVQRMLALGNLKRAKLSLWIILPILSFATIILAICGVCINVYYSNHDLPGKNDQIVPYYVDHVFRKYWCFTGIFYTSLLSASFSTLSTGINSVATVLITEIFSPLVKNYDSVKKKNISIITSICTGILTVVCCIIVSYLDEVLQLALSLFGIFGCTILSIFALGIYVIPANSIGALVGSSAGFLFTLSIAVGKYLKIDCYLFKTHYLMFGMTTVFVSMFVGTVVSLMTCCNKNKLIPTQYYSPYYKKYFDYVERRKQRNQTNLDKNETVQLQQNN
ncbi:Electrogenic sodium monocarboxylate cotransporter [Intoshia linei]|uniref:Electrogenic sodium monocarboxylate cotransporter n=1 Tax=Intoshia linei TaxID=1819745 RepID=A0A177B949_9BILA|nr:Electrogenic sodium monocarboxylate cotransporter [Intoshia linei]